MEFNGLVRGDGFVDSRRCESPAIAGAADVLGARPSLQQKEAEGRETIVMGAIRSAKRRIAPGCRAEARSRDRIKARRCQGCNVPLVKCVELFGWMCPRCKRFASEDSIRARLRRPGMDRLMTKMIVRCKTASLGPSERSLEALPACEGA